MKRRPLTPPVPPFPMGENPGVGYGLGLIGPRMADATNLVDTNLAPFVEHSITAMDGGGFKVIIDGVEYVPKKEINDE